MNALGIAIAPLSQQPLEAQAAYALSSPRIHTLLLRLCLEFQESLGQADNMTAQIDSK
jgi:hypothetical protein